MYFSSGRAQGAAAIDFVCGTGLEVTIAARGSRTCSSSFVLSHSGCRWAAVAFGETFEVATLQGAVWAFGSGAGRSAQRQSCPPRPTS